MRLPRSDSTWSMRFARRFGPAELLPAQASIRGPAISSRPSRRQDRRPLRVRRRVRGLSQLAGEHDPAQQRGERKRGEGQSTTIEMQEYVYSSHPIVAHHSTMNQRPKRDCFRCAIGMQLPICLIVILSHWFRVASHAKSYQLLRIAHCLQTVLQSIRLRRISREACGPKPPPF